MQTAAVIMNGPRNLGLAELRLSNPGATDVVVSVDYSGISTGTEKLLWTGEMPPFPGMGYPLVPGYESIGEVVEAGAESGYRVGERVFVPGCTSFEDAFGLFGGAAANLVSDGSRLTRLDPASGPEGVLLALAATARHAIAAKQSAPPELIVGHGVLGRLLARLTIAGGHPPPTVWEIDPVRMTGAQGYEVCAPQDDPRRDYSTVYDASGSVPVLSDLLGRIAKGGEIVLAGFYHEPISFAFPPAFMKEARLRVAAEWTPDDMAETARLIASAALSLEGLITHRAPAAEAPEAYGTAFNDSTCLKMILDWKGHA